MLEKFLSKDTVRVNTDASNWEDAVRVSGQLLVDTQKCRPEYVNAMVKTVQEMGPYMVIAPGLALVHARPEDGVLDIGISLITLTEPVMFGSKANDPVRVVISFCAVDKDGHIGLLRELAEYLRSTGIQQLLGNAKTVGDVLASFNN